MRAYIHLLYTVATKQVVKKLFFYFLFVSPEDTVRFIVARASIEYSKGFLSREELSLFGPQHLQCPFCALNFTHIIKFEKRPKEEDLLLSLNNLFPPLEDGGGQEGEDEEGGRRDFVNVERRFWSLVGKKWLRKASETFKLDFMLFGYDVNQYLTTLGISPPS